MRNLKLFCMVVAAAAILTFSTFAQGFGVAASKYYWPPISLPSNASIVTYVTNTISGYSTNIVTNTQYVLSLAGATGTNLINGWSTIATNTTTSIVWTNSSSSGFTGTFVTNTTTTYTTNTTYANFTAFTDRNTALQFSGTNANTPVVLYIVAKSVDGVNYDLTDLMTITSSNPQCFNTNITMDGFGYGRIVQITNSATATNIYTNNGAFYTIKQNSP